ncbi:MAG: hypothetical protein WA374_18380 [Acidobacteriaceae bacterium]
MAEITVEFTGQSQDLTDLSFALFETAVAEAGTQKEILVAGTLTMQPFIKHKAYGIPQYIEIVLSTKDSVAAGIVSNYIYDVLKT